MTVADIRCGSFLDATTPEGKPLDLDYIRAETLLILLAGADTTGTAFGAITYYVMTNPTVYEKLIDELDGATRAGNISAMPQYTEVLKHCPYYIACVRETLRLCPSVPSIFPRQVSKGGLELWGKHAPEGTEVTCNPWHLHRNKQIFGDDAHVFRPERWLESTEKANMFLKYIFTFGYGSRICLGKDLAMMELFKAPLLVSQISNQQALALFTAHT